jgi:LysR family glycine cleavage system transcriptional activator
MVKHLPTLSALRAFEATARHLSFTRAAIELNLTQAAISHRIKELEGLLCVQLFTRKQNTIALTDGGRTYLDAIRPALAQIATATGNVSDSSDNRLNITCLSAFAMKCLIPALGDFRKRHPEVGLRIAPAAVTQRTDLQDFDVAIWHGREEWPGFEMQWFGTDEEVFPVCTPQLLACGAPLDTPDDLGHYAVVRTVSPIISDEWPAWMQFAGAKPVEFGNEIYCEGLYFSMSATLSGLGVGIGRSSLVKEDLAAGRLVEPFDVRLPAEPAYSVINRPEKASLPKVVQFKEWLLDYFSSYSEAAAAPNA